MKILYFAWLRQKVGTPEETVTPPAGTATVGALIDWLKSRGPGYEAAFADLDIVRIAVNQEYTDRDAAIAAGDEIAFFPPVTGG
jgi:molybdopterin synthase sulfur carrier subunit